MHNHIAELPETSVHLIPAGTCTRHRCPKLWILATNIDKILEADARNLVEEPIASSQIGCYCFLALQPPRPKEGGGLSLIGLF